MAPLGGLAGLLPCVPQRRPQDPILHLPGGVPCSLFLAQASLVPPAIHFPRGFPGSSSSLLVSTMATTMECNSARRLVAGGGGSKFPLGTSCSPELRRQRAPVSKGRAEEEQPPSLRSGWKTKAASLAQSLGSKAQVGSALDKNSGQAGASKPETWGALLRGSPGAVS